MLVVLPQVLQRELTLNDYKQVSHIRWTRAHFIQLATVDVQENASNAADDCMSMDTWEPPAEPRPSENIANRRVELSTVLREIHALCLRKISATDFQALLNQLKAVNLPRLVLCAHMKRPCKLEMGGIVSYRSKQVLVW